MFIVVVNKSLFFLSHCSYISNREKAPTGPYFSIPETQLVARAVCGYSFGNRCSSERCGHCKKLAPEYEKLGASFKKAKSVLIGKVDCDEHKSVCSKYGVTGYPTIQCFPKGSLEQKKYEGPRTAEALTEFINTEAGTNVKLATIPSSVVVLTEGNFDEVVLDETKNVLVEFYAPWLESRRKRPFGPRLNFSAEEAVQHQLDALKYNDQPRQDYGVEAKYMFVGLDPFERSAYFGPFFDLGQFERFRRIFHHSTYRALLGHKEREILSSLWVEEPIQAGGLDMRSSPRRRRNIPIYDDSEGWRFLGWLLADRKPTS